MNKSPKLGMKAEVNPLQMPTLSEQTFIIFAEQTLLQNKEPHLPFSKMVPAMKDSSELCSALQAYKARAFFPTMLQQDKQKYCGFTWNNETTT